MPSTDVIARALCNLKRAYPDAHGGINLAIEELARVFKLNDEHFDMGHFLVVAHGRQDGIDVT